MSDLIGQSVGNFAIRERIGEGGMGTVYMAQHQTISRQVAIKVLKTELLIDQSVVKRFMEEARAAAAVKHPNVVDVHDVGKLPDGRPYILMELLQGESVARRLQRPPVLRMDEAIAIATQTTDALEAVHLQGIVHRDLKPDNLFLVPDRNAPHGQRVKVLDFGVAKLRGDLSQGGSETRNGSLLGTPMYMSPEQVRGSVDEIDLRTDVYALGIILYQMLCGGPPFTGDFGDLVVQHISQTPEPPSRRNRDVGPAMEQLVLKALAKAPAERFGSMAEFGRALQLVAGGTLLLDGRPAMTEPAVPPLSASTGSMGVLGTRVLDPFGGTVTTLSSATGETGAPRVTPKPTTRNRRRVLGVAGVVLGVAAGAVLAVRARQDGDPAPVNAPAAAATLASSPISLARPALVTPQPAVPPAATTADAGPPAAVSDPAPASPSVPSPSPVPPPVRRASRRSAVAAAPGASEVAKPSAPAATPQPPPNGGKTRAEKW